ncbi:hypothetical protein B0H14DRAFT_1217301 [Mycena olivaceomarginata]|nr:hypothetical protein B0H14DRAFT_1217301 [Mycena olivaceomarginata]
MHDPSRAQHLQQPLPIPPRHGFHLPARRYRVQRLIITLRSKPASCPAPGVRRAASPGCAASAMSIPHRPRRLHRLPGHRARPRRPRRTPLQSSACRAPRTRRAPSPCTQHKLQLSPHRPIPSLLPPPILSAIPPRSCRPCAARRVAASHHQRRLRFATMTQLRASSGRTTRRRCAPHASTGTCLPR